MEPWTAPPNFYTGQIISASQHMNALADCVQTLFNNLHGYNAPVNGLAYADPPSDVTGGVSQWAIWSGWVRHRDDTFHYTITVAGGGNATLKVNGATVVALSAGTYDANADISGLHLTVGTFYRVEVSGIDYTVWNLCETADSVSFSIVPFADESVPPATNWQGLSNAATALKPQCLRPQPGFSVPPDTGQNEYPWVGSILHNNRYLYCDIWTKTSRPYTNEAPSGPIYVEAHVWVNDVEVAIVRSGATWGSAPAAPVVSAMFPCGGATEHGFQFFIDLEDPLWTGALDLDLKRGEYYRVAIQGAGHTAKQIRPFFVVEYPDATPTLSGWENLQSWTHGQWVRGNTVGQMNVTQYATDIDILKDNSAYANPCIQVAYPVSNYLVFRRRWRWLHYTQATVTAEPCFIYTPVDTELKVSLPRAWTGDTLVGGVPTGGAAVWKVFDLDSAQGLYPGVSYMCSAVSAALEDYNA